MITAPEKQVACLEYLWREAAQKRDAELLSTDEFEGCLEAIRLIAVSFGVGRPLMEKIAAPPTGGDRFGNGGNGRRKA